MQVMSQPRSQGSLLPALLGRVGENLGNEVGHVSALPIIFFSEGGRSYVFPHPPYNAVTSTL